MRFPDYIPTTWHMRSDFKNMASKAMRQSYQYSNRLSRKAKYVKAN